MSTSAARQILSDGTFVLITRNGVEMKRVELSGALAELTVSRSVTSGLDYAGHGLYLGSHDDVASRSGDRP